MSHLRRWYRDVAPILRFQAGRASESENRSDCAGGASGESGNSPDKPLASRHRAPFTQRLRHVTTSVPPRGSFADDDPDLVSPPPYGASLHQPRPRRYRSEHRNCARARRRGLLVLVLRARQPAGVVVRRPDSGGDRRGLRRSIRRLIGLARLAPDGYRGRAGARDQQTPASHPRWPVPRRVSWAQAQLGDADGLGGQYPVASRPSRRDGRTARRRPSPARLAVGRSHSGPYPPRTTSQ